MKSRILFLLLNLSITATPIFAELSVKNCLDNRKLNQEIETKNENGWKSWCTKKTVAVTGGIVVVVGIVVAFVYFTNDSDDLFANIDVEGMCRGYARYWNKTVTENLLNEKKRTGN